MQTRDGRNLYFGDLHSHCNVGYGHGSLQDAYTNAKLQLDFLAVTPHAYWHDMPVDDSKLTDLVAYHRAGFKRTKDAWNQVREEAEAASRPGQFAAFLAYEWHSNTYGDHNVYFKDGQGDIFRSDSLEDLRQEVRSLQAQGGDAILIPHHIGYRSGSRGINWERFSPELSPVAEAMSMHGCAESAEAPYPYHHTMGSRDWKSTYQYGLGQGNLVGLIGSTDHHSAHPGSYGHGGLAVWAEELTRESIFEAIKARQCYAITGDKIALGFTINGVAMGGVAPAAGTRAVGVEVEAGSSIDYVEVLHNNEVIHRSNGFESRGAAHALSDSIKTHFEVGWGEVGENVDWSVDLNVVGGELVDVQPRFRGHSIVAPASRRRGDLPIQSLGAIRTDWTALQLANLGQREFVNAGYAGSRTGDSRRHLHCHQGPNEWTRHRSAAGIAGRWPPDGLSRRVPLAGLCLQPSCAECRVHRETQF